MQYFLQLRTLFYTMILVIKFILKIIEHNGLLFYYYKEH